ncbi:MAG: gamma-glutamyltransferase family protein [Streptosporangiales bacterium]|nr:gamma-glutamyltransferase family protein [Streptosporangiales bacterium]
MVASTHWLASAAGMSILERGGNAFDAATAVGFVLQVVEPHLNGPGGEVPVIAYVAEEDSVAVVAGQGPAPGKATVAHFRDLGLDLVPGTGQLATTVPGAFDGWMTMLARYGTMRPRDVLESAIGYARRGYPLVPQICTAIATVADLFREHWPSSAAVYLPDGAVPAPGSRLTNPALADTYERVLAEAEAAGPDREAQIRAARDAFYRGFVAEIIDRFAGQAFMDITGQPRAGVLTGDDLAAWTTPVEPPASLSYREYEVFKTGPWGQGPVFLQQLALLSGFDLDSTGPDDPEFVHTVVECAKLAFADRDAFYGDPRFVDVPLQALLSAPYADQRRVLVGPTASDDLVPGAPDGRPGRLPAIVTHVTPQVGNGPGAVGLGGFGLGEPTVDRYGRTRGDTCHIDVADRFGNMVSATPSGGWLHSSPVIPELGFGLNTRAQMFWLEEGLPSTLEPGKRPRTTLTPGLAFRDGKPYLAFGTPGGDQQDQWALLLFLRHVHFGQNLQQAIDAPAFHTTHFPSSFYPRDRHPREVVAEDRLGEETFAAMRRRGHVVTDAGPWSLGRLSAVSRGRDGFLRAAANPRGMQGYAVGR